MSSDFSPSQDSGSLPQGFQHLHAYWRIPYIRSQHQPNQSGNPFSRMIGEDNDRENLIVYRGHHHFVVLNRFPYNAGHCLLIPNREIADLTDMTPEEQADYFPMLVATRKLIQEVMNPGAINIGINLGRAAGAGIPSHLHTHLVPRWSGDTNFMPVIASTRVLPESLETIWEKMYQAAPHFFPAHG